MLPSVLLAILLAMPSSAQTPQDRWQTVETPNFRIHYPLAAEDWAIQSADQMEAIRERVIAEVGWTPPGRMDIVIRDPMSAANGSALPLQGAPRMEFWSTPPAASSVIGHYRTWGELLLTHEFAHQAHLLRPSRNRTEQLIENLTGIGAVARKCPRWVSEGYATVVEARLSGFGRPNTSYRAALLRRLAQEGKMPTYGALNDFERFSGGAFAYLVGSAYLEWLDARAGGDSLVKLWRRLTAVERRDFDEAFEGLYGASPARLYARFVAELTFEALQIEARRPVDEGTLWQDLSWYTGEPTVSPDGEKVALVVRSRKGPSKLRVWSTSDPDAEAEEERQEDRQEQLEKDPEDVLSVDPRHPKREELAERVRATRSPSQPRFMPDSEGLLFTAFTFDGEGRRRPDLYLWSHETGDERRVTVGEDVRTADPSPDGSFAIAVKQDWGRTALVRVDLETGQVEPLTPFDVGVVYDQPRLSPSGDRLAYLVQRGDGWEIEVLDFETEALTRIGGGARAGTPTHIAWGPAGSTLYASLGVGGFIEIHEVLAGTGRGRPITRSRGGALAPAPTPDGEGLFYLSLDYTGLELHRMALEDARPDVADLAARAPAVLPEPGPEVPLLENGERDAPRAYGLGRTEMRPVLGGAWSVSQAQIEAGVRMGDIIGRHEGLAMVAWGGQTGVTGALMGLELQRLPVGIRGQGFTAIEEPEVMRRYGGAASVDGERSGSAMAVDYEAGFWADDAYAQRVAGVDSDVVPRDAVVIPTPGRQVGYADLGLDLVGPRVAAMGLGLRVRGQVGATGGEVFRRGEVFTSVWVGRGPRLRGSYGLGMSDTTQGLDRYRLGGVPSAVLPEAWQWARVQSPGFALGSLRGANRDRARVALGGMGPVEVFGERHRMADGALGPEGASLVGLSASAAFDAQPYGKLPAFRGSSGLGCQLEDGMDGWDDAPCQAFDDYRFWVSATWRL